MLKWEQIAKETMAYCDLKEDPMFFKISEKGFYIKRSLEIAEEVANLYQNIDLLNFLEKHHVQVQYHEESKTNEPLFSQIQSQIYYGKKCKMIDIFLPCIIEKMDALREYGYEITLEELIAIHVAHEFYHFYEYEYGRMTYDMLPKITYKTMHFIHKKAAIHRTSEIAAHRFAQVVTHAKLHPKLMDYLYLIKRGTYQEEQVCQMITDAAEALQ